MNKHTPGPWVICTESPNVTWVEGQTIYSEPTGTRVADAFLWAFSGEDGVAANARLIAAAPDLLAALEKMYEAACHDDSCGGFDNREKTDCNCGMRSAYVLAEAAIAKATGETE